MVRAWFSAVALLVAGPLGCLPDPPVPRPDQGAAGAQGLGCSAPGACDEGCAGEGYFRHKSSGSCYFALDDGAAVPFADARAACRALGPGFDVVIPSTLAELQYIESKTGAGTWVGLTDEQGTGAWTWLDGEPSSFVNGAQPWSPGHPAGVEGRCAAFWDGKLWARGCSSGYTYACERPPASCQEIRAFNAAAPSGRYLVDPGGAGGASAYRLYCDMNPTPGGRDPCEGQPSCQPLPRSCKEIFERDPGAKDGVFRVDPDGGGGVDGLDVFCDMTFEPGGWTMLMATAGKGPSQMLRVDSGAVPGSGSYLAPALVFALTAPGVSSRVHVRTAGQASGRSITSAEGALPWRNLHDLVLLNTDSILAGGSLVTPGMIAAEWEGPFAQDHSRLWFSCNVSPYSPRPEPALLEWPNVYLSCGNQGGLLLVSTYSLWSTDKQSADNEDLEVYVR